MSLYLKYRPRNFKSVVGQDHAVKTIQNAIKKESLAHAYLFCGPRGTGKTSLARILAKSLNCLNPDKDSEPCNECEICEAINNGRCVDLIEIDAASNRGIDEIRELREKIVFAPSQAKTKVYIIDEVHMLTKEAFNALLKTLEEPPAHAYFVLATTEAHKIPETIVSRCQQFNFNRITPGDIVQRLELIAKEEGVKAENEALELIARISNGGLRDAIGLFEQMNHEGKILHDQVAENLGLTGSVFLEQFFQYLLERKALKAIEVLGQVNSLGKNLNQFVSEVIAFFREQMLINLGNASEVTTLIRFIEVFSKAREQMMQSSIPQLPIEIAIVKACEYQEGDLDETTIEESEIEEKSDKNKEVKVGDVKQAKETADKVSDEDKGDLTIDVIREKWQRVVDNVETPFIKLSLMDGEPAEFEKGKLLIKFKSSTMMEKIEKSANQDVVQKAFEDVFGTKLSLRFDVKKVNLTTAENKDVKDSKGHSLVEMAEEVFGLK